MPLGFCFLQGGHDATFFAWVDVTHWGATEEEQQKNAFANIQMVGKLTAKMIMKYILQQKNEYNSALLWEEITDK